jgi:hypothetical protein
MKKEDFEALRQLKGLRANNCKRTKPWLKATGPRTAECKKKATQNLPNQQGRIAKVLRNLEKLDEAVSKLRRREEQSKKKQLAVLRKIENLANKPHA